MSADIEENLSSSMPTKAVVRARPSGRTGHWGGVDSMTVINGEDADEARSAAAATAAANAATVDAADAAAAADVAAVAVLAARLSA